MRLTFDLPLGWQIGLPVAGAVLALSCWWQWRRGQGWRRMAALTGLRAVVLLLVVFLAARPVWVTCGKEKPLDGPTAR